MPPNTLRVHTEYVLVKSVGPNALWAVAAETMDAGGWRIFPSPPVPCLNCGGSILDKPDCAAAFKLVEEEKCPAIPETSSIDGLGVNHWMSCIVENASVSSVNGQIIHHDCGKGYRYKFDMQINSETGTGPVCEHAAVVKVYRAWQNGTVQNQGRGKCGAPRAIDDRGERRLRRCVRADRRATVEQLTTKMNQGATKSVSQTTIQRTLLRLGLRSRRLVRASMLTTVHRRRRLEFARQYSIWTSTEWRQVAFSDESRFMLHRTDGRWRIRRETSERNHPATIAGTVQAKGGSIMVWGMFPWHSLGSVIIVEGTIDQYKYASVLADHVHLYIRIVFPQDDGILMRGAIQLPVYVRVSKSTRMSFPSSPGQQTHLT
ncbi:transposable element Tcb1 transposase [Trichonephila clavipes]|nr:transposable element Tcb1 transposase [Trichonephila clavipes]